MKKNIWLAILIVVVIVMGAYAYMNLKDEKYFDPSNAIYSIDGEAITLINGKAEIEFEPGSASKSVVQIFGDPKLGDINGDGRIDAAMILTENSGGTGTFYYVVVALNTEGGAKGTNAIFLGDRIAPQTLEIQEGKIIANYADRGPNEPMATTPSIGVSKYISYKDGVLSESN